MIAQDPKNSLAGWHFGRDELARAISAGHMLNPSIDLSNACNLNCAYCYVEEKDSARKVRRPDELTWDETRDLIDDLCAAGARTINIVGAGEPTIDPHFDEVVDYIHHRGLVTVLFTNGIRLYHEPDLLDTLYRRNTSVVLKYNSLVGHVQDLVAGRHGYAAKRDQVLDLLLDTGFAAHEPTRLALDIIVFRGNLEEIPSIHRLCRRLNIFPIAGEFIPTGRTDNGEFHGQRSLESFSRAERERVANILEPITATERDTLVAELQAIDTALGIARASKFAYVGGGICTQILGLYVDIQGHIWPCVARKKVYAGGFRDGLLGYIRAGDRPSRIWREDHYMRQIRETFTGGCPYKPVLGPTAAGHPCSSGCSVRLDRAHEAEHV